MIQVKTFICYIFMYLLPNDLVLKLLKLLTIS